MRNKIIKMTQNKERNRDYVLCHPRYSGDPSSNFESFRLDSGLHRNDKNSGFTVLFAVIVSTLVLALGLGIVAITMKEVQLAGSGRDSQIAFYAADSGAECALYHDIKGNYFATSSDSVLTQSITCNGSSTVPTVSGSQPDAATSTFQMCMMYDSSGGCVINKPCVDVEVSKVETDINNPTSTSTKTVIDARGYNTCDTTHPRRLERGYRLEY